MDNSVAVTSSIKLKLIGAMILPIIGFTVLAVLYWQQVPDISKNKVLLAGIISLVLMIVLCWYAYQTWSLSNSQLANTLSDVIISSDFRARCHGSLSTANPISASLNRLLEHIQSQIQEFDGVVKELCQHSSDLSKGYTASVSAINQQGTDVQRVSASMEQFNLVVDDVSRNASAALEVAVTADQGVQTGLSSVDQLVQSVTDLKREVENSVEVTKVLEEETVSIGSVLDVIRGIAEQTNLLALNAAIEAARAGEQGRGFAVVADEVRTLANRTQQSTQEINTMIERLQSGVRNVVGVMDRGKELATQSVTQANSVSETIVSITESVTAINSVNGKVVNAVEEQSLMVREVGDSVNVIHESSSSILLQVEESLAKSETLQQLSQNLKALLSEYRT
ncbi:Methyl-accepting chemotaxis sensor/transducer protein [hydrothermal vent metagenome]|uniref:Methyl-accepting chemotaxis sensor/transducer protein n=1 Tax=hydrothermal vent metagenome TaxID=652676 RepID=A0A3B0Z4C6_9ZZZZ